MGIVREDFEGDGIHHLAIVVLRELQFNQVGGFKRLPIDRVVAMLEKPG